MLVKKVHEFENNKIKSNMEIENLNKQISSLIENSNMEIQSLKSKISSLNDEKVLSLIIILILMKCHELTPRILYKGCL